METSLTDLPKPLDPGKHNFENYPDIAIFRFLDIDYLHLKCSNGGDPFNVTRNGLLLLEQIKPENWYDNKWFRANREKLKGTSTVYKVSSKKIDGKKQN